MMGFRFHDPIWIAGSIAVLLVCWWSLRSVRRHAVLYSSLHGLRDLPVTVAQRLKRCIPAVRVLGLLLLVVALARPQRGREQFRVRTNGIAIELVIDRSGSMAALDFQKEGNRIDRLTAVKDVINQFVAGGEDLPGRDDDQIGLVVFGGYAEGRCPLTLDHGALLHILDRTKIPGTGLTPQQRAGAGKFIAEEAATAIGDALALGVRRVKDAEAKSRILILLSDGASNAGVITPEQAAKLARTEGVKVYTVGIGSTGMAPFPVADFSGRVFLRPQAVVLDEVTLKRIADLTGGRYFNARDARSLHHVYEAIDQLEKTTMEGVMYTDYRDLFELVLWPAAALLLLELLLSSTRFLTLP